MEMPPTKKAPKKRTVSLKKKTTTTVANDEAGVSSPKTKCAVCDQCIVDGKDQALLCEGRCKGWFHRYCAGVSLPHFERLASSDTPFKCVQCFQESYAEELSGLKHTVAQLRDEITHLRSALESSDCTQSREDGGPSTVGSCRVGMGRGGMGRGDRGGMHRGGNGGGGRGGRGGFRGREDGRGRDYQKRDHGMSVHQGGRGGSAAGNVCGTSSMPSHQSTQRERVLITGAKKVWGTLQSTTSSAVTNAISRLVSESLASRLTVKRKYKTNFDGSVTWWFVIRGELSDVQLLNSRWECISLHTNWKLEPMFRYGDETTTPRGQLMDLDLDSTILNDPTVPVISTVIGELPANVSTTVNETDTACTDESNTFLEASAGSSQ